MSIDYMTALRRLENHANFPGSDDSLAPSSIIAILRLAEQSGTLANIEQHAADVVQCLQVANLELNGEKPSESSSGMKSSVPLTLAYCVSGILSGSIAFHRRWAKKTLFPVEELESLEASVHMISYAWDQLLAGDIDDLQEDWRLSEWARGEPVAGVNAG
jgi:hypothetical protein